MKFNDTKTEMDGMLEECGYKLYEPPEFLYPSGVRLYQKKFRDAGGTKYYVNAVKNDLSYMGVREKEQPWYRPYGYEYHVQLYKNVSHAPVDMTFFDDRSWSIEEVEEFVEKIFSSGMVEYYERDDDEETDG